MNIFIAKVLIFFSGFYFTQVMPISPFHIAFLLGVFLFLLFIIIKGKLVIDNLVIFSLALCIYFLLSQVIVGGDLSVAASVIYSIIYFPIIVNLLYNVDFGSICHISRKFINYSTILLIAECIYRMLNPNYGYIEAIRKSGELEKIIYAYKNNSFMFDDSNYVAIFILILFFFCEYLESEFQISFRFQKFILFILCLLTFSRASIISMIIFIIIFNIINAKRKWALTLILLPILSIVIYITIHIFSDDISLLSKFEIINLIFKNITRNWGIKEFLFGVGFNNTPKWINISAHNIVLVYLFESGLFGLFSIMFFYIGIVKKTGNKTLWIVLPPIISGLSFFPYAVPYLYSVFGLLYTFQKRKLVR